MVTETSMVHAYRAQQDGMRHSLIGLGESRVWVES